ncbi:MAG: hypothetical protein QME40_07045 [bacterium]|nr:hypothetical protein [bacterium]
MGFIAGKDFDIFSTPDSTLAGDRDVEWSWIASQMPSGLGEALDFGCGPISYLGLIAAHRGFKLFFTSSSLWEKAVALFTQWVYG